MGHYDEFLYDEPKPRTKPEPRTQIEELTDAIALLSKAIDKQQSQIDTLINQNAFLNSFKIDSYRTNLNYDSKVNFYHRFFERFSELK